jgi:F-type H+-transporting ATPase subunit delta
MAQASDKELALANIYSRAMLELAKTQDAAESLGEELRDLVQFLNDKPEVDSFFSSPMVDADRRSEVIEKVLRGSASDLLVNALQVINRKGRLPILRSIAHAYELALEDHRGRVLVEVQTAVPLSEEQRTALQAAVSSYAGKEADLVEQVDESLIGGLVLRIGDQKIDWSVVKRLQQVAERLRTRASQEIHQKREYVEDPLA